MILIIVAWGVWSTYERKFRLPQLNCAVLGRLSVDSAAVDAAHDIRQGGQHLLGVEGYASELPGLVEQHGDLLPSNYRVKMLPCTTDAPLSARHAALIRKATSYAEAYNRAVLSWPGNPQPHFNLPTASRAD